MVPLYTNWFLHQPTVTFVCPTCQAIIQYNNPAFCKPTIEPLSNNLKTDEAASRVYEPDLVLGDLHSLFDSDVLSSHHVKTTSFIGYVIMIKLLRHVNSSAGRR